MARLEAAVVISLVLLPVRRDVVLLSGSGGVFDEPRKRPWRDNTVAFEQVVVERTASFTDSTEESEGSVVTAIGGLVWFVSRDDLYSHSRYGPGLKSTASQLVDSHEQTSRCRGNGYRAIPKRDRMTYPDPPKLQPAE